MAYCDATYTHFACGPGPGRLKAAVSFLPGLGLLAARLSLGSTMRALKYPFFLAPRLLVACRRPANTCERARQPLSAVGA